MSATKHTLQALPWLLLFAQQAAASSGCNCTTATDGADKQGAIKLKLFIAPILTAAAAGVLVSMLGRSMAALRPNGDIFFVVKAFAARVILATSRVHILPAAFDSLTSPYLHKGGGGRNGFHFAGLVAMCAAMATMVIDSLAAGYYQRSHVSKAQPIDSIDIHEHIGDEEGRTTRHVPAHVPATHGEAVVIISPAEASIADTIRHRVVSQANFKVRATIIMATFFSLTAHVGIVLGIAVSSIYNIHSPTSFIIEGVFNSVLIYMSLVDLLATDFNNPKLQTNTKLQLMTYLALFLAQG